jgi:hypothetical protein
MARLTAAERKRLQPSDFALGEGHYPIDTEARAPRARCAGLMLRLS